MTTENNVTATETLNIGNIVAIEALIPAKQPRNTPPSKYQPVIEKALTLNKGQGFSIFVPAGTKGVDFQRTITGVIRRFVTPTFKTLQPGMGLSVRQIKNDRKEVVAVAITCGPLVEKKKVDVAASQPSLNVAVAAPAAPAPVQAVQAAAPAKKAGVAGAKR
jgi:hypothetical protein